MGMCFCTLFHCGLMQAGILPSHCITCMDMDTPITMQQGRAPYLPCGLPHGTALHSCSRLLAPLAAQTEPYCLTPLPGSGSGSISQEERRGSPKPHMEQQRQRWPGGSLGASCQPFRNYIWPGWGRRPIDKP